jgi:hypothetical protein
LWQNNKNFPGHTIIDLKKGDNRMANSKKSKNSSNTGSKNSVKDCDCPKKDKDGNCQVPGVHSDSEPIGGG